MTKGDELADAFEAANQRLIERVQALTDEQWARTVEETGWSVGVTAHHLAESHAGLSRMVATIASGEDFPPVTPDALNRGNAEHARRAAHATREETVALARENGAEAAAMLRSLSDAGLQNTFSFPAGGETRTLTAEEVARNILIGHMGMHLAMIEKAIS